MKTSEIKKIARQATELGALNVMQLDEVLLDSPNFDRNARLLMNELEETSVHFVESAPSSTMRKRNQSVKRSFSSYGGESTYYIQQVRKHLTMNRDDEVRYAKRLEFFLRRLVNALQVSPATGETEAFLKRLTEGGEGPLDQSLLPLCTSLDNCPQSRREFVEACCADYNQARSEFVERNLHLVVHTSRQYRTYGIPVMDLIQEGNASLIRAVEKYDWRKGVRFQTYANFWIRQAIERWITANKSIVKMPNYLQQKIRRYRREGILPSDMNNASSKEISDAFDLSPEVAGRILETGRGFVSLDTAPLLNDDLSISDTLSIEDDEVKLEDEHDKLKDRLAEALDFLTDQERYILQRRFGLEGSETNTLDEIGLHLKVSRERIRQLQIRALRKIKSSSHKERLVPFLS